MRIRIFNQKNLFLTCDSFNWIICGYRKRKKKGVESEEMEDASFFSNLSNALIHACDRCMKECESLSEMKETIGKFKTWTSKEINYDALSMVKAGQSENTC